MNGFKFAIASLALCASALAAQGSSYNVAPQAKVTASSSMDEAHGPENLTDGIIRVAGKGEWRSGARQPFWGEIDFPWIQLDWDKEMELSSVTFYDTKGSESTCSGGELVFDDGSRVRVLSIPNGGAPRTVEFAPRKTRSLRFEVTDGDGDNLGLSEIEVFSTPTDFVSAVHPYTETTRGRYFFFVTGSQPFGMISAAPLTRNKNQGGGGYNYNSTEVLGFPQIHAWMLSGLDLMPTTGKVDAAKGEQEWKSPFSHDGEIVQPAYHRLYLEKYNIWVEQTNTDRASLYRLTFTEDADAHILLNLGGYISTATMVNPHITSRTADGVTGYFDTTGRLWGGPDVVRVYFAAKFDKPFESLTPFGEMKEGTDGLFAADTKATNRNEGMSYADAPVAGVSADYAVKAGDELLLKMAVSYTSEENAVKNLSEIPGFDFDATRAASQAEWNDMLGRIEVKGGKPEDRYKFYTDLWHSLLGRHKIDDLSGDYPDYTQGGTVEGKAVKGAKLKVRHIDGNRHHMYNSDALWLSQWNFNSLWGIAYPDILDDFSASFLQYSLNGGLLARGPCAGGYSFIMSGCPATSMITSAYQRGISKKYNPEIALREMVRNHEKGGMLAYGQDNDLKFYEENGYVPNAAGLTIQWSFEDWALAEMAAKMGKKKIANRFHKRAAGWESSFNPDLKLILPRTREGGWLHTDPLNGWGYEEANAWQATFGLSQDLPRLAELMGGNDSLCSKLNHAFEMASKQDFMAGYGGGYVSYSNQPGLSNAHVFTHAGHPELSQYWVRRVRRQAYDGITPDKGYGGHDEDQGQMGSLSALMSIGLFSIDGGSSRNPSYDITSPIFDEVTIKLHPDYCEGKEFKIRTFNNSDANCYINRMALNGAPHTTFSLPHDTLQRGGTLDIWLTDNP